MFFAECSHYDTMGCGVTVSDAQQIFYFTKNGETIAEIPVVADGDQRWFPAIGLKSERISARVLFNDVDIWKDLPPTPGPTGEAARGERPVADRLAAFGQELNCPICWNILDRPKMFPCQQQHSYCLQCLRGHVAAVAPGEIVRCPVCRVGARLTRNVDELPDNPNLNRLIEVYKSLRV